MITSRSLAVSDLDMLQKALDANEFHPGQDVNNFTQDHMYSRVYEDEQGPIGVLRYTKVLRLATVWCDNKDAERNRASIIQAISDAVESAKQSGYTEIVFNTNSPKLAGFCKQLGFEPSNGEYVKYVKYAGPGKG